MIKDMEIKQLFYNIAVYGNTNWKYYGSMPEVIRMATDYYNSYLSNPNGHDIETLLNNLKEDADNGNENAQKFYDELSGMINGKEEVK